VVEDQFVLIATIKNADAVAWICFVVGLVVLLVGVGIGLFISLKKAPATAADAKAAVENAKSKIDETKARVQEAATPGLEAGQATSSAQAAVATTDAAKSALEQVSGIVGSLPEPLRFAGMLVLVGTVLVSVATIQFGGVKLF
jgi:hypothetical protein